MDKSVKDDRGFFTCKDCKFIKGFPNYYKKEKNRNGALHRVQEGINMAYLNKVMVIGNVGQDPKIFTFQNGKKKASFSVAASKRFRDANGEPKEQTTWVNCSAFGKLADVVEDYVGKGSQLFVEGELSVNNFTDQNGYKKSVTEVRVTTLQMLDKRNAGNGNNNQYSESSENGFNDEDGDVPF